MPPWRHGGRLQSSLAGSSVQCVLAHPQQAGGFAGSDKIAAPALDGEHLRELIHVARVEPPVSAASDDREQNSFGDGAHNGRPAHA